MSTTEQKPLEEMTVAELRKELGIAGVNAPSGSKKELLQQLVKSAREKPAPAPAAPEPEVEAEPVAEQPVAEEAAVASPEAAVDESSPEDDENIEAVRAHAQAIALREENTPTETALLPTVAEFTAMREMAAAIASTQMVPRSYRGKPDDVLAAILTGREMGLPPMQSLRDLYVIDGKPALAAHLLLGQLRKGGVVILDSVCTKERAWIKAQRADTKEICEVEFTAEDAADAGLAGKDNWKHYGADMNWARCVGRLARRLGPDLIGSALPYSSEEVQDWDSFDSTKVGEAVVVRNDGTGGWDAPNDWTTLFARLAQALGEHEAPVWMEELAELGYAKESIRAVLTAEEVSEETKKDLGLRLRRVLRTIEEGGDLTFAAAHRARVIAAFKTAFDDKIELNGPGWALQPDEGDALPTKWEVLGLDPPEGPTEEERAAARAEPEEVIEDGEYEDAPAEATPAADEPVAEDAEVATEGATAVDDDLSDIDF